VRKIARTIVRFPAKWYCNYQFKQSFTNDYDTFWVVDIDNTIADSWRAQTPQYIAQFRSESNRIMSIQPFESMQQLFQNIPPRTRVIFLSARYYIRYFVTKKWLKKHGFWQPDSVLVLVEQMRDKAPLLTTSESLSVRSATLFSKSLFINIKACSAFFCSVKSCTIPVNKRLFSNFTSLMESQSSHFSSCPALRAQYR
jgi:hypothetical protein